MEPLFVLIQNFELSLALFVVVMFIGCLNRGGPHHWLKPVRSELSIVAWFLSLGHMAVYLESYLPRLLGGGEIGGNVMGAFVLAVVLLVLLVVLGVTSFAFVKRQMSTASWKKVQKLAYPFFGLVYVHLLLMLLPSALHGGLAAQASVAVYSVVFVDPALCAWAGRWSTGAPRMPCPRPTTRPHLRRTGNGIVGHRIIEERSAVAGRSSRRAVMAGRKFHGEARACVAGIAVALALLASVYIASSGTAWLSHSETNGGNLSVLTVTTSLSAGGLVVHVRGAPGALVAQRPTACLWAGAVSSLGALIVILIGPYYLSPVLPYFVIRSLFFIGGVLFGVGLGAIALRCGQLYGALPPRQVILYVAYSQFVVGASFFVVLGSPGRLGSNGAAWRAWLRSAAPVAGVLASFSRHIGSRRPRSRVTIRAGHCRSVLEASGRRLRVLRIASSVYASTVVVSFIETTLSGSRLVMLARMLLALVLAVVAVGTEGDRLNFGKLYSVVMVASVALVACLPLVTVLHTVLAQVVSLSSVVFELFLWCILAFIVFQRRTSAVIVFGYGYGAYQLGNGIGWLFGAQLLGTLFGAVGEAFAYMIMALIVLACAFLIFSEREFDRLFAPGEEGAPSLDELLMRDLAAESEGSAREDEPVRKGLFGLAIEALAADYQLSPRETDVLRCLAMGYNSSTTASKLSISWNTVRTHTRNVYGKLGVHSQQGCCHGR
ncbi:MAG: helix-turn-helix transcriptional regulator [Coriobacteriaceae bacterium]